MFVSKKTILFFILLASCQTDKQSCDLDEDNRYGISNWESLSDEAFGRKDQIIGYLEEKGISPEDINCNGSKADGIPDSVQSFLKKGADIACEHATNNNLLNEDGLPDEDKLKDYLKDFSLKGCHHMVERYCQNKCPDPKYSWYVCGAPCNSFGKWWYCSKFE